MLQALLRDLAAVAGVSPYVCRDVRLPLPALVPSDRIVPVAQGDDASTLLAAWFGACDAIWPIAPETGGILESLCARAETAGKSLLTAPAAAVRVCGDKLRTYELLQQHAIASIPSQVLPDKLPDTNRFWVVKARDGAGCENSFIVAKQSDYEILKASLANPAGYILQPLAEGKPASLSALFKNGKASLLSYNEQHIAIRDSRFVLEGCTVNAACRHWPEFELLLSRVAQICPELWGYVGIDILETKQGPLVVEINPRLTTSYAKLSQALELNVARSVVNLLHGDLPPARHRGSSVMIELTAEKADAA